MERQQESFLTLLQEIRGEEDTIRNRQFAGETVEGVDLGGLDFDSVPMGAMF